MPYRCDVRAGRLRLAPAAETAYAIVGPHEQSAVTACAPRDPGLCRTWLTHRLDVDCDGARVSWLQIVGAMTDIGRWHGSVREGRLHLQMGSRWASGAIVNCSDSSGAPRGRMRPLAAHCAPRHVRNAAGLVALPVGFAPVLGSQVRFARPNERVGSERPSGERVRTAQVAEPPVAPAAPLSSAVPPEPPIPVAVEAPQALPPMLPPLEAPPLPTAERPGLSSGDSDHGPPLGLNRDAPAETTMPVTSAAPRQTIADDGPPAVETTLPPMPDLPPLPEMPPLPAVATPPAAMAPAEAAPPAPPPRRPAPQRVSDAPEQPLPSAHASRLPPQALGVLVLVIGALGAILLLRRLTSARPPSIPEETAHPGPLAVVMPLDDAPIGDPPVDAPPQIDASAIAATTAMVRTTGSMLAAITAQVERLDGPELQATLLQELGYIEARWRGLEALRPAVSEDVAHLQDALTEMIGDLNGIQQAVEEANAEPSWPLPQRLTPATINDAYAVLGVNADATETAIKKVVDGLRQSWHPDLAKGEGDRAMRERRIKSINVAWELIRNQRRGAAAA